MSPTPDELRCALRPGSSQPVSSRRAFLRGAAALGAGLGGLRVARAQKRGGPLALPRRSPLVPDPAGRLDLPEGFRYTVVSVAGEPMDDGLLVPPLHDGMASFPGPGGDVLLVRNHEITSLTGGAFGERNELLTDAHREQLFDVGRRTLGDGTAPCMGGTTTLRFDPREQRLVRHHLSLGGTLTNCAGGPTPWGTWISCEENVGRADAMLARDHGWAFEVPAAATELVRAEPLVALGRFKREAVAVSPETGIVYQTEDEGDGLLYRFLPESPGDLRAGGRLQALAVVGASCLDTSNHGPFTRVPVGERLPVRWIDLEDVEAQQQDLRHRGFLAGAARFVRGEGIAWTGAGFAFVTTIGGPEGLGQIWRYHPGPREGERDEVPGEASLELFLEARDPEVLERGDNLVAAPWGDLVVCEDGPDHDRVLGVTPEGGVYEIARNAHSTSELAGPCFSPDGSTLFFNVQREGWTVAVTGPWERLREAAPRSS